MGSELVGRQAERSRKQWETSRGKAQKQSEKDPWRSPSTIISQQQKLQTGHPRTLHTGKS